MEKSYKEQVIQSAIHGLKEGGMIEADLFELLLSRVYDSGYNECIRNLQEKINYQYSDTISDGNMTQDKELIHRITEYLSNGGLFNPEYMNPDNVRDLLLDIREYLLTNE